MISYLLTFLAGLAFTLWLARRPTPIAPRFGSAPRPENDGWLLIIGAAAVAGAVGLAIWRWMPTPAAPAPSAAPAPIHAPRAPARLLVPALGVDAPIVTVPLVDGAWDISRLDAEVGWLESTGAQPGADWAMSFIGHVTLSAVERGPFADLWALRPLTEVVYRSGETDYFYVVNTVAEVTPQDVDRLYVPGGDRLLLVTCTDWNYLTETYDTRLVAEAVLVRQQASP